MITKQDLQEAIAECEGDRHPNANTCIKLAAFYTILDHLFPDRPEQAEPEVVSGYSFSAPIPGNNIVSYHSDSEFSNIVSGMNTQDVWPVIDELMETLKIINPRLYEGVLRKLNQF